MLGGRNPIVPDSLIGMGGGSLSVVLPVSGAQKNGRGMQPAGGDRRSTPKVKDGRSDVSDRRIVASDRLVVQGNNGVVPLSVEAEEFSLKTVPKDRVPTVEGSDGSDNCVSSREIPEGIVGWSEAVVLTTAVAGAASPTVFAGVVAPADLAGTDVPAVVGMKFLAVAEVSSSALDAEGVPLVTQASGPWHDVVGVGPVWPGGETGDLVEDRSVPEPLEHSVVGLPNEVGNSSVDCFAVGDWVLRYYSPAKKCRLDSAWAGPYLVVSLAGWAVGIQLRPYSPIILVHCQDLKKIPRPSGLVSWIDVARPVGVPTLPVLGASTMSCTTQGSPQ